MKKLMSIMLALLMVLMLAACGDAEADEVSTPDAVTEGNIAVQDETQETENETEIVFEEMTVVDNEYCTIKITEIIPDDVWGYTLKLYLENKSSDRSPLHREADRHIDSANKLRCLGVELAKLRDSAQNGK